MRAVSPLSASGRGQFGEEVGKTSQVVVCESPGHLEHDLDHLIVLPCRGYTLLLPKKIELNQQIWRRLSAKRRDIGCFRLAAFAVAGKTRRGALDNRLAE
jgi:hypothetical protein